MPILKISQRLIIIGGFAVAVAVAPVATAAPSSSDSSSTDASHKTSCSATHDISKHDTNISYSLSCQLSAPLPSGAAGGNGNLSEAALTAQRH